MPTQKKGSKKSRLSKVPEAAKNDIKNLKSNASDQIAPHYDTRGADPETNTDVEIAKGSMGNGFQTDSRPKDTN